MTGTNCDLFTHKSSRSYLNHLVFSADHIIKKYIFKGSLVISGFGVRAYSVPFLR
jgi:histone acetyltransferase (RNA polymerase elongator complex component)